MGLMWWMRTGSWDSRRLLLEVCVPLLTVQWHGSRCRADCHANGGIGIVFGGLITGFGIVKFGRQLCILGAYVLNTGGIFLQFFATTPAHFFGGKILTGIPLGVFATVAPTYASEMAPLSVRGAVTAGINFAIVLGQLIGFGVERQASFYTDARQYKVLFATQWGYVVVGLLILPFLPE